MADVFGDTRNDALDMDAKIAYHEEMEHIAMKSGDFTRAEHHRNMQAIYRKMMEK